MTSTDSQQIALNREVASLNAQRDSLRKYKTAKASTLSAMQNNRWAYNLGRVFAGCTDGLEGEISQQIQRSQNQQTNGVWVPNDVLLRDLSFGGNAALLVSSNLTGPTIIDGLRPFSPVLQLGVEVQELPVTGTFTLPREQLVPQTTWGTENQSLTPTSGNPSFDQTPATELHRASNITKLSAQLVKQAQASVGLVNWFSAQVRRSVADAISSAVLAGSGTNSQPLGIVNAPQGSSGDINTITLSNPKTWAQLVAADSTVENLNAYSIDGTSGWIVNSNTKASWAVTPKTPTALTNGFLFNPESKTVNGHKTFVSKEIGNFAIFASRWSSILVVLGGATSVLVDPYTQAHVNNVRVITDSLVDVVFRRRETICVAATTF